MDTSNSSPKGIRPAPTPSEPETPPVPALPFPAEAQSTPPHPQSPPHPAPTTRFCDHLTSAPSPLPPTLSIASSSVSHPPTLLIGVSGCTSSGKTTLAHLLSLIFPSTSPITIIHQDDFFVPEYLLLPADGTEEGEVDARDAVNFDALYRMLRHARRAGRAPHGYLTLRAEQEEVEKARSMVDASLVETLQSAVRKSGVLETGRPVVIVDGFLLYHDAKFRDLLNVKPFVRASGRRARDERFERAWYRIPGVGDFWQTGGYFDRVVWLNYAREHEKLVEWEDVERIPVRRACDGLGIGMQPKLDGSVEETLVWAVNAIVESCGKIGTGQEDGSERRGSGRERGVWHWVTGDWLEVIRKTLFDLV